MLNVWVSLVVSSLILSASLIASESKQDTVFVEKFTGQEIIIPRAAYCKHMPLTCEDLYSDDNEDDAVTESLPRILNSIFEIIETLIGLEDSGITGAQFHFNDERIAEKWAIQARLKGFLPDCNTLIIDPDTNKTDNHALTILSTHGVNLLELSKDRDNRKLSSYRTRQLMHHKVLFFHKNTITGKPLILTGSYNCTVNARMHSWENIVVLDDEEAITLFKDELEKLERFCTKITNRPSTVEINVHELSQETEYRYKLQNLQARKVKVYMRPEKGVGWSVCALLQPQAQTQEMRGAYTVFADKKIIESWLILKDATPALKSTVIIDRKKITDSAAKCYNALIKGGFQIRQNKLLSRSDKETMHNKFCIITSTTGRKIIVTGSEHPNDDANSQSWQNTIVIIEPDAEVLSLYENAFNDLLKNSEDISALP